MEKRIAVITNTMQAFDIWIREKYKSLPPDKSLYVSPNRKYATVEHPEGVKRKYIAVQTVEDLQGYEFEEVEKVSGWYLRPENLELFDYAIARIKPG